MTFLIHLFFICSIVNNKEAYEKAKKTVREAYSVVGLMEDVRGSLRLMEKLMPKFVTNITKLYDGLGRVVNKLIDTFISYFNKQ